MKEYIFKTKAITRCFECPFRDGLYCLASDEKPINKYRGVKTRESFCPLVELPPHGRLIDADKLLPESGYEPMMFKPKYGGDYRTQYNTLMGYEILGIVDDASTILEASEE